MYRQYTITQHIADSHKPHTHPQIRAVSGIYAWETRGQTLLHSLVCTHTRAGKSCADPAVLILVLSRMHIHLALFSHTLHTTSLRICGIKCRAEVTNSWFLDECPNVTLQIPRICDNFFFFCIVASWYILSKCRSRSAISRMWKTRVIEKDVCTQKKKILVLKIYLVLTWKSWNEIILR